ncbi:fatty acid elongase 3-like [Musa acuminata AAA Group]|uniref:fatty acid elongase 3-like n=1 Tax=Musa acuminata AAA Group TaxID=214697 RepID=UPI0031CFBE93
MMLIFHRYLSPTNPSSCSISHPPILSRPSLPFGNPWGRPFLVPFSSGRGVLGSAMVMKRWWRVATYWLAEHPAIVGFRWSHAESWGSTWPFLICSVATYTLAVAALRVVLWLVRQRRPVPLGPLPALHSLAMAFASTVIFLGLLLSVATEIRDARLFWQHGRARTTPLQWLLCFPLGTRPFGRIFFWSYAFYLSRFLHLLRTFLAILRLRPGPRAAVLRHSALLCMSFLWLEFSQSFQVVAILSATAAQVVVFGYRFWVGVRRGSGGGGDDAAAVVLPCQAALMGCNLACHLAMLLLHFAKGGCNGIQAWVVNLVLNAALLLLFVYCYVHTGTKTKKGWAWRTTTAISTALTPKVRSWRIRT